ncbi:MAG: hypothetical protein KJ884_13870 [Gammaproteobacteria bacterium]|nr:hypothetical protein [Gammaproteobacteria bacterium]MBU1491211.1 hypothetical protein [Gammaproteobacteria bacterium]MBU2067877.1 hypothetical protein [Gammaproteobacteria bacterium]MBU2139344.1 hypothetical protein [Gammaproteobacteria bacterium]MBU2217216.1 hypothetical protein [Gammaproteobacteria bacterium]
MGTDNLKDPAYPFDHGWDKDADWLSDSSGNRDLSWATDRDWSPQAELPNTKPGNGGASFAAWEQKAEAQPELADWPPADMLKQPEPFPPGFYVVPRSMSGEQVLAKLFAGTPHADLVSRIKALNPTFAQGFKAGEMFILGNLLNPTACLREEADLMAAAAKVRTDLEPLSEEEANFMARHQAEIALMIGGASESLGVGKDVLEKGLKQIGETLSTIEYLHQREFTTHGHLQSPQFFASRQQLYRQLDNQLKATFLGKQLGLGSYPTLRRDLGISSRSLVHHWSRGGAPGQIPGYATHMDQVAKAAKYLKYGGYIGIGLAGASSALKVQEVCRAGETEACQRVRFTETGSFWGGLGGGTIAVAITKPLSGAICAAIGLGSAGIGGIACGLVVVGGASLVGGAGGGFAGELAGEKIYERSQK